jgi:hypothetical protein
MNTTQPREERKKDGSTERGDGGKNEHKIRGEKEEEGGGEERWSLEG